MTHNLDFLSDQDIRQIAALVDTLDRSGFDYLQLDVGTIKVTIGKGALPAQAMSTGLSTATLANIGRAGSAHIGRRPAFFGRRRCPSDLGRVGAVRLAADYGHHHGPVL